MSFVAGTGLKGIKTATAYLWSDNASASTSTPNGFYRIASPKAKPTVHRTYPGRYVVTLPSMPKGGGVEITAYGNGKIHCQLDAISNTSPLHVGVSCFKLNGVPTNSQFTLSYTR